MKIKCSTKDLAAACKAVSGAVKTISGIAALQGIKLTAKDNGKLELCGYNLETGIITEIDATVDSALDDNKIVLDAKMLSSIVNKMPGSETEIETGAKNVTEIRSGDAKFSLAGISAKEYPELPEIKDCKHVSIPQGTLKDMIYQTLFCVSQNDAKPIFTGTLFEVNESRIRLVSVDGYRLAIAESPLTGIEYNGNFVVPAKALNEVSKLLSDKGTENEDVSVSVAPRHAVFAVNGTTVFSRLLEGDFLDYKAACTDKCTTSVKVDVKELTDSVQRVSIFNDTHLNAPVKCNFSHDDGAIGLSYSSPLGKASDHLQAEISGNNVEIGFNPKYLTEALRHTMTDKVQLRLSTPLSPLEIVPCDGSGSFRFLVLPVRLGNMS